MKQLLEEVLRDTDRHAAAELRQMLQAEMAKPPESRDYDKIRSLSEACCDVMGVRKMAEASAAYGIRSVRDRIEGKANEAACETYIVKEVKPNYLLHFLTAAAACLVVGVGIAGGGLLLRNSAQQVPAPLPDLSATSETTPMEPTQTEISTTPVIVPEATSNTTAPAETTPPETVYDPAEVLPQATEPPVPQSISTSAGNAEPEQAVPVQTDAPMQTDAPETVTENVTETVTEAAPESTEPPTEGTAEAIPQPTPPLETEPYTRLLKLRYELGWIPDGYTLTSTDYDLNDDYEIRILTYTGDNGTVVFRQRTRNAPPLSPYETGELPEDYTTTNIRIGPFSGQLVQGSEDCALTWDVGEYLFTLTGTNADDLTRAAHALRISTNSSTK